MINITEQNPQEGGLELTPLIDIIFIVVVFLLLTANSRLLSLPVQLPDSEQPLAQASTEQPPLRITLRADTPHWHLDQQPFADWSSFRERLLPQLHGDAQVLIATDRDTPVEPLLQLMALLKTQQITDTQILMEKATP